MKQVVTTDSHFIIGSSHKYCQDFSDHDVNERCLVLADGCSSSHDSAYGANTLVKSFLSVMRRKSFFGDDTPHFVALFNAYNVIASLGLDATCLDTTLFSLTYDLKQNIAIAVGTGDGVIAIKRKDGLSVEEIRYPSSAPYYLSYNISADRRQDYFDKFGKEKQLITHTKNDELTYDFSEFDMYYKHTIDLTDVESIGIFSDGVCSFKGISTYEVVENLMAFKNPKGECLKRRMKKYLQQCAKTGNVNVDDVSGSIVVFADGE